MHGNMNVKRLLRNVHIRYRAHLASY